MVRTCLLGGWLALLVVAGCAGNVTDDSGSTSGTGGSAGAGGDGGGGGGLGAGGGGEKLCGGKAGLPCSAATFCRYDDPGTCGNADGTGHCIPRPDACPENCSDPPLCGCDGKTYCNSCDANAAGTDVSSPPLCGSAHQKYTAAPMFTDIARFAIFKTDFDRGVCIRLIVEGEGGGTTPGISTPSGWSVSAAEITEAISDCMLVNGSLPPPAAGHVSATGGSGAITFQSSGEPPSEVTVHGTLSFPSGGPPWAPASEPLDADHLLVQ